ncbi:MAG: histidine kinase [Bacteroidia bacterium]|nr:histidine kinase [Bacteroidia bacterium]
MKANYLVFTLLTLVCTCEIWGQTGVSLSSSMSNCRRLMIAGKSDSLSQISNTAILEAIKQKDTVYWYKFLYFKVVAEKKQLPFNGLHELLKARQLTIAIKDKEACYKFDVMIGPEYRLKGDYDSALYFYNQAISFAEYAYGKGKMNPSDYMRSKGNLAAFFSYSGKENLALSMYLEMLKMADSLKLEQELFNTHVNIASIFQKLGKEEKSKGLIRTSNYYFKKATQHYSEAEQYVSKDVYAKSIFYKNYSELQYDLSNVESAQTYMKKAIEGFKETYPDKLCGCYRTLGDNEPKRDKEVYYRKSIDYSFLYPNISCRLATYVNLANLLVNDDKLQEAKDTLNKALQFEQLPNLKYNFKNVYYNLYEIYKRQGEYKKSLEAHEHYLSLRDSIFPEQMFNTINRMELLYDVSTLKQDVLNLKEEKSYLESKELKRNEEAKIRNTRTILLIFIAVLIVMLLIAYGYYRIARQRQAAAEMEHRLLRARMNPHFIFNSLNSIQEGFMEGNLSEANKLLSDFSNFIRQILYKTGKTKHSLHDELQLTKMYLDLEKRKYPGKFEFSIEVDSKLDQELIQMPTLVLQPIVENAIFHGILNNQGFGRIKLEVLNLNDNWIKFVITDNGIGYAERKGESGNHISQGINILKKRLGQHSEFLIVKVLNEDFKSAGTRVSFKWKIQK